MTDQQTLRIVVFKDEGMYVAQCLEYDVCTQGSDIETLKARMDCLLELELSEGLPIDEAPETFHKMWASASALTGGDNYRLAA